MRSHRRIRNRAMGLTLAIATLQLTALLSAAAPLQFVPQRLVQPDGSILQCFASGDEFYNWLHDINGYTILQDPGTGFYVYALKTKDRLVPSTYVAGKTDPAQLDLQPWLNISPEVMELHRDQILSATRGLAVNGPTSGVINNVVIFIRFADEAEFTDQLSTYTTMFNATTAETNSLYNYYKEASYNNLQVTSTFYPTPTTSFVVSYQDSMPRGYYQPYNATTNPNGYTGGDNGSDRTNREQLLLKRAVDYVKGQVPPALVVDSDGDGTVDNVCFIVSGSPTGWSSLLWPHQWALYTQNATINGKRVSTYNFQLQTSLLPSNVGVLAHEMFHTIGAPDLYHYTSSGTPVGSWDLMASNTNPPQHMGTYMKYRYGKWISSIPTISTPGRYVVKPVTSPTGNCFKIPSPYSTTEFFIVEYRKKTTIFEKGLPGEGLLVYRINSTKVGNAQGPPDEIYVYRPGGTLTAGGSLNKAALCKESGVDRIYDGGDPSCFLTSGSPGGLDISDVSTRGDTIAFTLGVPVPAVVDSLSAASVPGNGIVLTWTTSSEFRDKGFEVQRSIADTGTYDTVPSSFVAGHGTSTQPQSYTYTDGTNSGQRYYRLMEINTGDTLFYSKPVVIKSMTAVREVPPTGFSLSQNYPNPFNPTTAITFSVERTGHTTLVVYDLLGRKVTTLFDGTAEAGRIYNTRLDGKDLASGAYYDVLESGGRREVRRVMLVR